MTLRRLSSSSGILARKGAASPLGLRTAATDDIVGDDPGAATAPSGPKEPTQLTLVSDLEVGEGAGSAGEPPPPASLLPFALHRKRRDFGEAWELVSPGLMDRISQAPGPRGADKNRPETAPAGLEPGLGPMRGSSEPRKSDEPEEASTPCLATPVIGPLSESAPEPAPGLAPAPDYSGNTAEGADDTPEAQPAEPVADPAWRIGVDTLPVARHTGAARWLVGGAAAVLLVGGIAWWSFNAQAPTPEATTLAVEPGKARLESVEPGSSQGQTGPRPTIPAQGSDPAAVPAAQKSAATSEPNGISTQPGGAGAPASAPAGTDPGVPSVDLVRIEPNGEAVIAGRAAPNSELILLDNGAPIGTVKADAFGEWVFVPAKPLPQGGHEFGLVLKSVQGTVSIPAEPEGNPKIPNPSEAPAEAEPGQGDGAKPRVQENGLLAPPPPRKPDAAQRESGIVAPIPERKPDLGTKPSSESSSANPPSADFVVQLASVKTRDGARQEWRKLQSRFPEALSGMNLSLHETKLSRRGTVIRVRTGPFPGLSEAADFCAQIRTERQDCLVVRTNGGN